jgi:hypothetical protein
MELFVLNAIIDFHIANKHVLSCHTEVPCFDRAGSVISRVPMQSLNRVHNTVVSGINVMTFTSNRCFGLGDSSQREHGKPRTSSSYRQWDFFPWPQCSKVRNVDKLLFTPYIVSDVDKVTAVCPTPDAERFWTAVSRTAFFSSEVIWIILRCPYKKSSTSFRGVQTVSVYLLFHKNLRRAQLIVVPSAAKMYQHKYNSPIYCCWRKQEFLFFFFFGPSLCYMLRPFLSHTLKEQEEVIYSKCDL